MGMIIFTDKFVDEHIPIHLLTGKPITAGVMRVEHTGKGDWYSVEVEHYEYERLIMGWWVWLHDFSRAARHAGDDIGGFIFHIATKLKCRFEDNYRRKRGITLVLTDFKLTEESEKASRLVAGP